MTDTLETIISIFCNQSFDKNLAKHNAEVTNAHFCSNFGQSCRKKEQKNYYGFCVLMQIQTRKALI